MDQEPRHLKPGWLTSRLLTALELGRSRLRRKQEAAEAAARARHAEGQRELHALLTRDRAQRVQGLGGPEPVSCPQKGNGEELQYNQRPGLLRPVSRSRLETWFQPGSNSP